MQKQELRLWHQRDLSPNQAQPLKSCGIYNKRLNFLSPSVPMNERGMIITPPWQGYCDALALEPGALQGPNK